METGQALRSLQIEVNCVELVDFSILFQNVENITSSKIMTSITVSKKFFIFYIQKRKLIIVTVVRRLHPVLNHVILLKAMDTFCVKSLR
jgi:hypothetical protein